MANVRCPMCGKENPLDASECSYCGARLKPVRPPEDHAPEGEGSRAAGNDPEDEPEWLRALRKDQPASQSEDETDEPGSSDEDVPEWLTRIRSRGQDEAPAPSEDTEGEGQEQVPDWLQNLGETTGATARRAESEEDWMSQLTGWQPESAQGQPDSGESDHKSEENLDWTGGEIKEPQPPAGREESFGLTGFLSSLEESGSGEGGEAGGDQPGDLAAPELPEWLGGEAPAPSQPSAVDWGEATMSDAELPDWLRSLDDETSSVPVEPAPGEEGAGTGGVFRQEESIPEWLGGEAPAAPAAGEEDLPAWLAGLAAEEEPKPAAEQPAAEEPAAWMQDPGQAEKEPGIESGAAGEQEAWPETGAQTGEELPDWLGAFQESSVEQASASAPLFAEDEPELTGFESSADLPGEQAVDVPGAAALPEAEPGEEVPEWLRAFDQQQPAQDSIPPLIETGPLLTSEPVFEGDQPFTMDELPDWLSEDSAQQRPQESEQVPELNEPLAQADLPEWVKDMRPIETIIPGEAQLAEAERRTEKSGPLAGVSGVLPAEDLATRYSKPPIYSVKLHMSEKQRVQASQLETILAQETQPLLIRPQRKSAQGLLLRILVALLLIVGLTLPPLMGIQPIAQPQLFPVETQHMYEQIEGTAGGPVLLAVDFEPAFYGEMRLAAQPVLEHLVSKNDRLVIVSTRSSGPALAQKLIADTAVDFPQYDVASMTDNLGFLPGDTISLLEFAVQPSFAAPANLGGELAWNRSTLAGISTIRDFSSVIVLTDTAETGRAWVEQVRPLMGDVPLLMVTSAQAGPMMAPYVQSEQVSGMVTGQMGGLLYSRWAKQTDSPVSGYLASFQVGMLIALGLAMLGILVSGVLALLNRGRKEEE